MNLIAKMAENIVNMLMCIMAIILMIGFFAGLIWKAYDYFKPKEVLAYTRLDDNWEYDEEQWQINFDSTVERTQGVTF